VRNQKPDLSHLYLLPLRVSGLRAVFCYRDLIDHVLSALLDTPYMHLALAVSILGTHASNDIGFSMFLPHCRASGLTLVAQPLGTYATTCVSHSPHSCRRQELKCAEDATA
jgi:hypothetical protein